VSPEKDLLSTVDSTRGTPKSLAALASSMFVVDDGLAVEVGGAEQHLCACRSIIATTQFVRASAEPFRYAWREVWTSFESPWRVDRAKKIAGTGPPARSPERGIARCVEGGCEAKGDRCDGR